jgi:hypothetical protein
MNFQQINQDQEDKLSPMSANVLLLTFGCSWTAGVGVGYEDGMSENEYREIAWNSDVNNKLSWRGLLSDRYNLFNRNFSFGGSSNQGQERIARQYFTSHAFQEDQNTFDKIILLWGITSTARNEMFILQTNKLDNFFLTNESELSKSLLKFSYNHDFEVWDLAQKMRLWNLFFTGINIKNCWFDTFNHHNYNVEYPGTSKSITQPGINNVKDLYQQVGGHRWPSWESFCKGQDTIDNEILKEITDSTAWAFWRYRQQSTDRLNLLFADQTPRDLMSLLCIKNGFENIDQNYHVSNWHSDTNRIDCLVKKGILNPISMHPTKQGHLQISDIMADSIESLLS